MRWRVKDYRGGPHAYAPWTYFVEQEGTNALVGLLVCDGPRVTGFGDPPHEADWDVCGVPRKVAEAICKALNEVSEE